MANSILIIRFSAIGDVAMLVPVVHALAVQHPDVSITVLSRPFARVLFEGLAPNVSFIGADLKKDYKGIGGLNRLYSELAARHFTHIADCHSVLRTHYLRLRFILAGYKVEHIDKHRKEKHALCKADRKESDFRQLPTSFRNYADVIEQLGFKITPAFRSIFGDMKGNLRLLPQEIGERKSFQKWIGIAPFATHQGKIYPMERIEKVIEILLQKHPNARIFLFHGPGKEAERVNALIERVIATIPNREGQGMGAAIMSASMLLGGMDKELILMSHLNVMLSMDSSNMHLASLVGCPVVGIWGATHRYAGFLGWNQSPENCVERDLPCRPCSVYGNRPCMHGDYRCMDIAPEVVVERIEKNF